jgi:hypothetical protein
MPNPMGVFDSFLRPSGRSNSARVWDAECTPEFRLDAAASLVELQVRQALGA